MCESNSNEDLMSFEVLPVNGHDSLPSDYSLLPEVGAGSFQLDFSSPDLSLVEVQQKITELANDNAVMKNALERNNTMMKEQLNTISAWHSQITTSMSHQQMSLKEYQERCEQLLKENQELKEKVKEIKTSDTATETPSLCNQEYQEQCEQLLKENQELKERVKDVKTSDTATETLSLSNQESPAENSVAKALIDANNVIAELKLKLDEQESMMLAQYQSAQDKIERTENEVKSLQQVNSDLQCLLGKEADEVQNLKEQLKNMEIRMLKEQNLVEAEKTKHAETKKLFDDLQAVHMKFLKEQQEQQTSEWEKQSLDHQRLLVQVDGLTAQLLDMQDKLTEKEEKVEMLTHQLEAVNKDSEAIPILKSQLEVFRMDLEQARESKKTFEEEVQRLNKVVEEMQARNNPSAPPVPTPATMTLGARKRSGWHGSKSGSFECPICGNVFSDAQAAQNHANRCLDRIEGTHEGH